MKLPFANLAKYKKNYYFKVSISENWNNSFFTNQEEQTKDLNLTGKAATWIRSLFKNLEFKNNLKSTEFFSCTIQVRKKFKIIFLWKKIKKLRFFILKKQKLGQLGYIGYIGSLHS